jgi:hypothetical protein
MLPLISSTIFNFDALCTLEMYSISKFWFDIGYDVVLQYRDIRISKVKTLMSISKFSLWYQRFCRYQVRYPIPGADGRTGHVPAPLMGSAKTNLLVLDLLGQSVLLRDCPDILSCWSSAAFCCCSGPAMVWTAGQSRWAVLISSYRSTSDLVMIHMMSVNYAFRLSLVFCLDSASDASVFAGPGAEPAGPAATDWQCWATAAWLRAEACRLMTWHHDHTRSCQAICNNNPGTSISAVAIKLKLNYGNSVNCRGTAALN